MSNLQASHILIFSFTSFYCDGEVTSSCPKSRLFLMLWTHSSPLFSTSLSWSLLSIQPSSHIPHLRKQNTSPFKFLKKDFFYVDHFKKVFIEFVIILFLFSVLFFFFFFSSIFFSLHFLVLEISTIITSGSKILYSAVSRLLIKLSKAFFILNRFFYFKYFISILRIF